MKRFQISYIMDKFIIIFLIIQPIFDLKIFYNSYSTLIRVIIVSIIFIYIFIKDNNKKKYTVIWYLILLIIYFIAHHINAQSFFSLVPGNFNYNVINEILYFIKMLIPYLLIYIILKSDIQSINVMKIAQYLVCIIGGIIIITNILKISYGSYSDTKILANFFEWFNANKCTYKNLASKGLFEYANQISAILIMFLPITIYKYIETNSVKDFVATCINVWALMLLGTKVSVLGVAVVIVYLFIYFLLVDRKMLKRCFQQAKWINIIVLFYLICLPFNPTFQRIKESEDISNNDVYILDNSNTETNKNEDIDITSTIENSDNNILKKYKYVEENYKKNLINENFILNCYPYKYDVDFWYRIIQNSGSSQVEYRFLEEQMVKRVIEINDNGMDKLLGITYTRVQNIFNIEKDFVVQYYSLGIIGTILIFSPYLLMLIYKIYINIKEKSKLNNITNIAAISIMLIFIISYCSGNLLNSLSFTIYLSIMYYLVLNEK